MIDVAITMVNTNEREDIERCLGSLYSDLKDSGLDIKIVVVDNASTDNIESFLLNKFPKVELIKQKKNYGFGKSHNEAMKAILAKYYFILNPDTIFTPGQNLVKKMFDFMEAHPRISIIGPKIVYPDGLLQYSCYRFPKFLQPLYSRTKLGSKGKGRRIAEAFLMKDFDHNKTQPVDWIMGSAMFVRQQAVAEVGMFDDRYWMYAEDSDWCRRMWESGWPVYYVHNIVLQHFHRRASAKVPGVLRALIKNKYARVHLISWLKYFWKWRGNHRYYAGKEV